MIALGDLINENSSLNANGARRAYEGYDTYASRNFHDERSKLLQNQEAHNTGGESIKSIVFGGLDGILTAFAIVAGAAGGALAPNVILILGFSNIFADALAMAVGEFLSANAENEWILSERKRESWEMDHYPEGEIQEMIDIYTSKGMSLDDATVVIRTMSKYKEFFVDVMMKEELELQVPKDDHKMESIKNGFVMFCSFAVFGSLPLLGYIVIPFTFPGLGHETLFKCACTITGIVLFAMGSVKSIFSSSHWFWSGFETLLLGGLCASVAYCIGQMIDAMVP